MCALVYVEGRICHCSIVDNRNQADIPNSYLIKKKKKKKKI